MGASLLHIRDGCDHAEASPGTRDLDGASEADVPQREGEPASGDWEVGDPTAQAEALPPNVLLDAIRDAAMEHVDPDVLVSTLEDEKIHRDELIELFDR